MGLTRITPGQFNVGDTLPWPVKDSKGMLLLRQGFVISSRAQVSMLESKGWYEDLSRPSQQELEAAAAEEKPSPFQLIGGFQVRLRRICEDIKAASQAGMADRILHYCKDIQRFCSYDADAALGAIHLMPEDQYTVVHSLHSTILAELVLRSMSISEADRLPILAASLTHDLGMMGLHEILHKQTAPLSEDQWAEVRKHPERSVEMLRAVGVTNETWLETVLHHHERLDGSGYPFGLQDEDIGFPVRVMAIIDIYSAMIKRRAYREPKLAKDALRDLFLKQAGSVDEQLTKIFVKELGIFPPGALVRLGNGELAVVTHRGSNSSCPIVHSVVSSGGAALVNPIKRDTNEKGYAIKEMVERSKSMPINPHVLWGYA